MKKSIGVVMALAVVVFATRIDTAAAEEKPSAKDTVITLADGQIQLNAPKQWQNKKPRTRIVDYELAIPAVEGNDNDGRVTVMGAGGSIKDNIGRWIGQFTQPDGKPTRDRAVVEMTKVAGQEVHTVDISGTFNEQFGPFAPAKVRENYRMLGAIIVTDGLGQYFVKAYGPRETMAANEKLFSEMIKSLKVSKKEKPPAK